MMPRAAVSQCVALSCDIEPRWLTESGLRGLTSPTSIIDVDTRMDVDPWLATPAVAAGNAAESMFYIRHSIAISNTSAEGPLRPDSTANAQIRIDEFARWARSLGWWLPKEMSSATSAATEAATAPWIVKARERADKIYRLDRSKDLDPTKEDVAKQIEREFERDHVKSQRGKRLSWTYIRRHALNDWRPPG